MEAEASRQQIVEDVLEHKKKLLADHKSTATTMSQLEACHL